MRNLGSVTRVAMVGGISALMAQGVYGQALPLGFSAPVEVATVLGPGIVSLPDRHEYCATATRDGQALYYGVDMGERAEIRVARAAPDGVVHQTLLRHERYSFGDPMLSLDELRLYFVSNRPESDGQEEPKDFDIWYLERDGDEWGPPTNLGAPVNSESDEFYTSFTDDGRLFFASNRGRGDRLVDLDLFVSEGRDGVYSQPQRLGPEVNSDHYDADPFVSRDGSLLIFGSVRPGGRGRGDIYISRSDGRGAWTEAVPLGPVVNTEGHELCPVLTPSGAAFIFTSEQDLHWVDASILDEVGERR